MTFEEFFKKKRIDLAALQQAEPALSAEFELHFEQMGEKSFDHTKKYWFNKLRKQFHLAPEVKSEKAKVENQLAEQTVTDELREMAVPSTPKVGFTPRFKAPTQAKPVEEAPAAPKDEPTSPETEKPKVGFTPRFKPSVTKPAEPVTSTASEEKNDETPVPTEKPKVGFTPRFKAGVTKPVDTAPEEKPVEDKPTEEKPKVGFTPRFKAGLTKPAEAPADVKTEAPVASEPATPIEDKPAEEKPKIGFTPRFKAGVTKPAETTVKPQKEAPVVAEEKPVDAAPTEDKPKIGFTPRFKAGVTKPAVAPAEEPKVEATAASVEKAADVIPEQTAEENPAEENPKIGFTPRFKAGVTKQAPPPAED